MVLIENYNSCKQKYGSELTNKMVKSGIPAKYLLSACRFKTLKHIPIDKLASAFKEWNSYVLKYNPALDVNKISYEKFLDYIFQAKLEHCLPNTLIVSDTGALGRLDNVQDARNVPVETSWCIKARNKFNSIINEGDELYAIYLPYEQPPFTFSIVLIQKGNVSYFNSDNQRQYELDTPQGNMHQIFQSKLPQEIIDYLYDRAAIQTEKIESQMHDNTLNCSENTKSNKVVIKLMKPELYAIIAESVRKYFQKNVTKWR